MNLYPYIVATHIIFIVTWFAGLFYIVRLFIYHREAMDKSVDEKQILCTQYEIMETRLMRIITTPSMYLAVATGITLLIMNSYNFPKGSKFIEQSWMHLKLFFVVLVIGYHHICASILKQLKKQNTKWTSQRLRIFNEIASIFLVAIVFLAVLKNLLDMLWGLTGLILLSLVLMLAIKIYKKKREKKSE